MGRSFLIRVLALLVPAAIVAGCGPSTPDGDATAPSFQLERFSDQGTRFEVDIEFPRFDGRQLSTLNEAISRRMEGKRRAFVDLMNEIDEEAEPGLTETFPWHLRVRCNITRRTARVVSLVEGSYAYTGGAHGNTALFTYNFDVRESRMLALADLFADDSHEALLRSVIKEDLRSRGVGLDYSADYAHMTLDLFTIRPDGLTFHFEPYVVASHAAGPQQAFVAFERFAALLRPEYRECFDPDPLSARASQS